MPALPGSTNFAFLGRYDDALVKVAALAERYFPDDPVTCVMKLRQFAELLARETTARLGLYAAEELSQTDILSNLRREGSLPADVLDLFHYLRRSGNLAMHEHRSDHATALSALKIARQLSVWFHRTFGDPSFKPSPFQPPISPPDPSTALQQELDTLRTELEASLTAAQLAEARAAEAEVARQNAEERARKEAEDRKFWETYAAEAEKNMGPTLALLQQKALTLSAPERLEQRSALDAAAKGIVLDESSTRALIDAHLRARGWDADSKNLRHASGVRPAKGRNYAIAEWPTASGPADYALFVGTTLVGFVEAKRRRKNVSAALDQASRYSQGFKPEKGIDLVPGGPWLANSEGSLEAPYQAPLLFSANGRPYLKQIETESGIWFRDVRIPTNRRRALADWPTPEGVLEQIGSDRAKAHAELEALPFDFAFPLRNYQMNAIRAVEDALSDDGKRTALLAMATGTGKTKIAIAMLYRLLATKRFRRVCFVVDRTSLGEQAAGEFSSTRIVGPRTFAQIFGLKELGDSNIESSTKVHICTIQSLVQRVLYARDFEAVPPIDQYDLMVVDECHRGYTLDREMSDAELSFRSEDDYISKYRRALEHFDAVKIGLTATPALHTTQIFGDPIFTYSYREAVVDGWLIDHEPRIRILTELSRDGIHFKAGEDLTLLDPSTGTIDLTHAPDDLHFDVDDFNKRVLTREFNRVVATEAAKHIDPILEGKTLVFAATDGHADLLVDELKSAFEKRYGSIDDAVVQKVTGSIDRPARTIKRFRNDANPKVAVTVDLLTTGIDVPQIVNLVFVRRVNSRILYEQMLGRATRRCDEINKETFRIFDAVDIYDALEAFTTMKPVVVNPSISLTQLLDELGRIEDNEHRRAIRDEIIVKMRRRLRHLPENMITEYTTLAGEAPAATLERMRAGDLDDLAAWANARPGIGPILDWSSDGGRSVPLVVSEHYDRHLSTKSDYADGKRPEDYLDSFVTFVRENENKIAALEIVARRPRDLTRAALRELALALAANGFSEAASRAASRDAKNEDIAATLVGYVRQAALGDALEPWSERVQCAIARMLQRRQWTDVQRKWLVRIGQSVTEFGVADSSAIDEGQFRISAGGFARLNRVFEGELQQILGDINDELWKDAM